MAKLMTQQEARSARQAALEKEVGITQEEISFVMKFKTKYSACRTVISNFWRCVDYLDSEALANLRSALATVRAEITYENRPRETPVEPIANDHP